jgi:hypothetical protein
MTYKDWTIMQKSKGSGAATIKKAPSTYAHDHAFRVFKIQNADFKSKCAANKKTTKGFVTSECEDFIHDVKGVKGQFYCTVGKKGSTHDNEGKCSIATVKIGDHSLSDAAEASFTDECDSAALFADATHSNIDMDWVKLTATGQYEDCNDPTCKLDKNAKNVGVYHLRYTVRDRQNNANSITFPIQLIDDEAPVIHMEGCTTKCTAEEKKDNKCECAVRLQASNTVEYTDYGAQCHDYVDGVLSHAVEVSGQVVNMRVPATYQIQYDCADLSGNAAVSVTREVFVEDTEKPVMTFDTEMNQGTNILFVEAGFPFADAGATMSDSLDGVCVTNDNTAPKGKNPTVCNDKSSTAYGTTYTYGDTINVFNNYYNLPSCKAIHAKGEETSGRYVITVGHSNNADHELPYSTAAQSNGIRQIVNCYMPLDMTFMLFRPHNTPKCENVLGNGAMLIKDAITAGKLTEKDAIEALTVATTYNNSEVKSFIMDSTKFQTESDVELVCVQMGGGWEPRTKFNVASVANTAREDRSAGKAEAGVYKIVYDGKDVAGNYADKIFRTVIVKDTLPPVITLGPQTSLMAETTSVNGWFIGALACAVSGVALLATSMKKTATAVPV